MASDEYSTRFLCLDTSAIDGRLFSCASPAYVTRRHLLRLARLPNTRAVEVHAGDDPAPLSDEGQFHVETGDTFVVVPAGAIAPTMRSLALDLLSQRDWSRAFTISSPSAAGIYGLVHENEAIVYEPGSGRLNSE